MSNLLTLPFVVGQTYIVTLNDSTYHCVAWAGDDGSVCIGNGDIYGGAGKGGDEPFSCDSYEDGSCYLNADAGTYTISITTEAVVENIQKIPQKFLPDMSGASIGAAGTGKGAEIFNRYGGSNTASGDYSHAEGFNANASGHSSHAEGWETTASKMSAHAEGGITTASGEYSHAEGYTTTASGDYSHAEGSGTTASGNYSHAEGGSTAATSFYSHAEGYLTIAASSYQHVQGKYNIEDAAKTYAHIVGNGTGGDNRSNAHTLDWNGNAWYKGEVYVGGDDQSTGEKLLKQSDLSNLNIADGSSEGSLRTVLSAEESDTYTIGTGAFTEGYQTQAYADYSHVSGQNTVARTRSMDVIGEYNTDTVYENKLVETVESHYSSTYIYVFDSQPVFDAESGTLSFGTYTKKHITEALIGDYFVYFGNGSAPDGQTKTYFRFEAGQDLPWFKVDVTRFDVWIPEHDRGEFVHVVGNGVSDTERSNAHTLDWEGNAWFAGDVYVGSTSGTNKDDGSKVLATKEYVDSVAGGTPEGVLTIDTTDADAGTVPYTNSDLLGGVAASEYALKSDILVTSVNSKTGNISLVASDVGAAPTAHASSATTYGIGNGSNYGHVKLSDSTSSTSAASAGIAASPAAVKAAYDLANSAMTKLNSLASASGVSF